jgi:hypothetical protein
MLDIQWHNQLTERVLVTHWSVGDPAPAEPEGGNELEAAYWQVVRVYGDEAEATYIARNLPNLPMAFGDSVSWRQPFAQFIVDNIAGRPYR